MTTTPAREAIRRAAAENGWTEIAGFHGHHDRYQHGDRIIGISYTWTGVVRFADHRIGTPGDSVGWAITNRTGKRQMVLSWLTQYGAKAQPTPAPAPVAPDTLEPGGHQRALAEAELINWISTRMTELRLDVRNHREQLAALATTETIARLSRHLRGAMVAEEQLYVFQDALTAAVHRPADRPLADVIAEALESYLTFQTPSTERERARLNARMLAAKEIGAHLDGIR